MKSPCVDCSFLCLTYVTVTFLQVANPLLQHVCMYSLTLLLHCVRISISQVFYIFWVLSYPESIWYCCGEPVLVQGSDFFPGAVLLKWFCLWRLWLKSLPFSLQAVSGWHAPRNVIASKGVKIKSLGGGGVKAACVHTVWSRMFFPSPLH